MFVAPASRLFSTSSLTADQGLVITYEYEYDLIYSQMINKSINLRFFIIYLCAVVLDVNRSLKRFPPGIGEAERPALQEQLTRLIIRVIMAHPRLHYYQGKERLALQEQLTRLITRVIMAHPRLHYYQGKEGGQVLFRRSGGLVVSIPATRPPVPGSNLGPSLLTVWSEGQQITL